jgi:hypothetical protein
MTVTTTHLRVSGTKLQSDINKEFEGMWSWSSLCLAGSIEESWGTSFSNKRVSSPNFTPDFPHKNPNAKHCSAKDINFFPYGAAAPRDL